LKGCGFPVPDASALFLYGQVPAVPVASLIGSMIAVRVEVALWPAASISTCGATDELLVGVLLRQIPAERLPNRGDIRF
jgi:hypothetical protein